MFDAQARQSFESIWAELKLLLEWQQGFGFYLVFGDDQRVSNLLRQRIEDATRLRSGMLQWVRPDKAELAVETILKAAFPEGEDRRYHDWRAPLWIELTAGPGQQEWQTVRQQTLAALNRRRSALEQECPRPVFLQLPEAMLPEIVVWAPDLWSIRQFVALLPTNLDSPPDILDAPVPFREQAIQISQNGEKERQAGRLDLALAASRESAECFRLLRASRGDSPQTLRDLSVSLHKLGDAERDAGNLAAALAAFRDSLKLSEQLRASLGDTPQTLRDLSVSLNKLGDAERDAGNLAAALAAFRDSLQLARQLRTILGDTPQVLRDLAVSLERVSSTERLLKQATSPENEAELKSIRDRLQTWQALPTHK